MNNKINIQKNISETYLYLFSHASPNFFLFFLPDIFFQMLIIYTPKNDHRTRDYNTLPAIKILLDWMRSNEEVFFRLNTDSTQYVLKVKAQSYFKFFIL